MASLFGGVDPLATLRMSHDSRGDWLKAFEVGANYAQNKQRLANETQRVANDTARTSVDLQRQNAAMGVEAIRNQDEALYQGADLPLLVQFGQSLSRETDPNAIATAPLPQTKTAKGLMDAEKIRGQQIDRALNTEEANVIKQSRVLILDSLKDASPDTRINALPIISKPQWAQDPAAVSELSRILGADIERKQQNAVELAETRRLSAGSAAALLTDEELIEKGLVTPEQREAFRNQSAASGGLSSIGGAAGVRAREGVDMAVKALNQSGITYTEAERLAALDASTRGGVSGANAPQAVVKEIETENKSYQLLDDVTKRIDKFNAKYGQGAFSDYVGPIDAPVFKFRSMAVDPAKANDADREARDLFRSVNFVVQQYRRGNFGTALTANETQAFQEIVAPNSNADYVEGLKTFKDNVKRAVGISVRDHKMSPNINITIKERFLKDNPSVEVVEKIEVIAPNGQRGLVPASKLEEALKRGYRRP